MLQTSLAKFLTSKWILARLLMQTFEELYLKTPLELIWFDIPFAEIPVKNWLERAYYLSKGELISLILIDIDMFIQCKV